MQQIINYSDNKIRKIIERIYSFDNQEELQIFFLKILIISNKIFDI